LKKILIIRFSSIGDIVLTTPVVRCLKQQLGAEIHYLTKQPYLPLLEANPHIDRIFTIKKNVPEVLPDLRRERYDCVVDLHKNLRTLQVRLGLFFGVKWLAFNKLNFQKWLLTALKINRLPKIHIVDRYLAAVEPLGVKNDGQGLDFSISKHQTSYPIPHTPYLAFAIGAQFQTKRLPVGKIVEICQQITQPIVLLGGKAEAADGELIAEQAGSHVSNLCGKLSLQESAEVIRGATLVITHDTGMMHIAAAFQQKILSIWGNTIPALGMAPYYGTANPDRNTSFEVEGLPCRPCSKIGHQACPKGHFRCMNGQDVEKIVRQATL
jgi:ADP-heptose:LPS heptosyltransferase